MDGFFGIGIQELVLIAIVALIVLGPERLPATFREIAKFIRQVRNLTNEFTQQFGDDFKALEDLDPRRMLQQAIESIDEEEKAKEDGDKGKTTPAKTTTPTPANKSTTPKPATATKPATPAKPTPAKTTTSTTTAKPAASSTKPTTETQTAETATDSTTSPLPAATEPAAPTATVPSESSKPEDSLPAMNPETTLPLAAEPENRIAPPAAEVAANGTQAETPDEVVARATVHANGTQEHPLAQ
ncbi:MAG: Sec-independent protein translocase protein TatB [Caldilineaceae bacterium]|nr:Sec-independent protein translocase protein TatB [Caldilineaceae bacterium]